MWLGTCNICYKHGLVSPVQIWAMVHSWPNNDYRRSVVGNIQENFKLNLIILRTIYIDRQIPISFFFFSICIRSFFHYKILSSRKSSQPWKIFNRNENMCCDLAESVLSREHWSWDIARKRNVFLLFSIVLRIVLQLLITLEPLDQFGCGFQQPLRMSTSIK